MTSISYYVVKKGRKPGIYTSWQECKEKVHGYKGGIYKKFKTLKEAEAFFNDSEGENDKKEEKDLKEGEVIAYVDGSFQVKTFRYSFGYLLIGKDFYEEGKKAFEKSDMSSMRNVAGEIEGAMYAMKRAVERGYKKLYLHYDYTGIEMWAKKAWKANLKGTKAYSDFYENIKKDIDVDFIHVMAHTGIEYNERVDKLAKEALDEKVLD